MQNHSKIMDMQISHSQLHLYSGEFVEENTEWGQGNIEQGVIINAHHIVFDPIIQEPFSAKIYLNILDQFIPNPDAIRSIATNIQVVSNEISLFSVPGHRKINEEIDNGWYFLFFEECETEDVDEIFFVISLIKTNHPQPSVYLQSDSWGGIKGMELKSGKF